MLDVAPSHDASPNLKPPSPVEGGKRIPASIMKMRRESLAASGKYQLPTVDAGALPDNSLMGMASKMKSQSAHGGLPSYVTPLRYTNKSLKAALDLATSHLPTAVGDLLFDSTATPEVSNDNKESSSPAADANAIPEGSLSQNSVASGGNSSRSRKTIRRWNTVDSHATSSDMDSLLKSGLATPRRTTRRSLVVPTDARLRISKLQKAGRKSSAEASRRSSFTSHDSNTSNGSSNNNPARRMARPNRSKSSDDGVLGSTTPRRSSRKAKVSRVGSHSSTSNSSDDTPVPIAASWKCTCGEEQAVECKFCGMCGTPQRWECADCSYANKCKFRFCGMCGVPKKVKKGQQD